MHANVSNRIQSLYVGAVGVVGLGVIAESVSRLLTDSPGVEWFLLAALTLVTGSFTVKLPGLSSKISISETFVFTSVLLFGPAGGTLTVVLDTLAISLWMNRGRRSLTRVLFNISAAAIALRFASEAFFRISSATPGAIDRNDIGQLTLPIFALAFLYFVINTALVAGALKFERHESALRIWWTHYPQVSITYFVGSSVAMLVVAYTEKVDITVVGIILPLLVIWYLTFKRSMGRLEDAQRHVAQVNELYLSTIEALAMAVDAKDQVTHGHIRRVQVYAVELARKLGVGEGNQLKAIEAAALLHDMGKLAIPEHILNKPGKLTPAEFEKMKLHAAIGADLLSSVRFPYPVVPIVRHHHENWNGAGYPGGLAGTDIPLGARILSVVDCFDALTSDRPYRPALSDDEAFAILRERRGNMYDPLVVDTFIAVHGDISASAKVAGEQARSLTTSLPEGVASTGVFTEPHLLDVDLRGFEEEIAVAPSPQVLAHLTEDEVARWMPADLCVLYLYAPKHDRLEPYVADSAIDISEILIGNGERTSGWAVANGVTAANSPAALDLQHLAALFSPPLELAVATPMKVGSDLVGALTVYSSSSDPYSGRQQRILEKIAASVAPRIRTLPSSIERVRRAS